MERVARRRNKGKILTSSSQRVPRSGCCSRNIYGCTTPVRTFTFRFSVLVANAADHHLSGGEAVTRVNKRHIYRRRLSCLYHLQSKHVDVVRPAGTRTQQNTPLNIAYMLSHHKGFLLTLQVFAGTAWFGC